MIRSKCIFNVIIYEIDDRTVLDILLREHKVLESEDIGQNSVRVESSDWELLYRLFREIEINDIE